MEDLYGAFRAEASLKRAVELSKKVTAERLAEAFERSAKNAKKLSGSGPFHPSTTRKSVRSILEGPRKDPSERYPRGHEFTADIWQRRLWDVRGRPDLCFYYLDREIEPGRLQGSRKGAVSADLLLVNACAGDWTPIVGEVKVRDDKNPMLALTQVLAATAQLSPKKQRRRIRDNYSDFFGKNQIDRLDAYVVSYDPPKKGTFLQLYRSAVALRDELTAGGALDQWVRRIEFLEAKVVDDSLVLEVAKPGPA
jgi:hypothetical protein